MDNIFALIKQIPLTDILSKLWIHYDVYWNDIHLYEWDKSTDWWRWDIEKWFIKDFSKNRAQWDRITFVQSYLNISKWDAVVWIKEKFMLPDDSPKKQKQSNINFEVKIDDEMQAFLDATADTHPKQEEQKVDVIKKWEDMKELSDAQIKYLNSRWVDYNLVKRYIKNNNWYVCCPLSDTEKWKINIISIQNRDIHTKKFVLEKWLPSKWCFISSIDKTKKYIYVVEGMFDFLSLAQYTDNVIGMKSANDGADVIKQFADKWYLPILIPDNDEAGKSMIRLMEWYKTSIFDLAEFNVKDINELLTKSEYGIDILQVIEDWRTREPLHIQWAMNKLVELQTLTKKRGKLWYDGPPSLKRLTDLHQWIIEWKVYTIWAYSGNWKSTLSYEYVSHFIKQNKKILYFSVEVGAWLLLAYIARNFYKTPLQNIMNGTRNININDFENLYLYDNVRDLWKICEIVKAEKPDIVFIDFAQWVRCEWSSIYERTTTYALNIQALAIETNATIFTLSQLNNDSKNKEWWDVTLKWSGDLFSSSDVIITLSKENNFTLINLMKNKFWKKDSFYINFNFDVWWLHLMKEEYETWDV